MNFKNDFQKITCLKIFYLKRVLNILFFLFLIFDATILKAQNKNPNIIYILADDMGYGDVSALNENSKLHTLHIDALAREGMRFTDAHSNSALCTPTRYGILTGRYAWRTSLQHGVLWSYDTPLIEKNRMTVASLLKVNGYHTACIGKWHLGLDWGKDVAGEVDYKLPVANGPVTNGFDYFFGITASLDIPPYVYIKNDHVTATSIDTIAGTTGKGFWRKGPIGNDFKHAEVLPLLTGKAVDYINTESKSATPFFLYFALTAPHTPMLPSKEFLGKSGTNAYGDFVLMVDAMVGKIIKAVQDAGIENNTLIIFASDNGCSPMADFKELAKYGHHPSYIFRGAKSDIFEGGHRIPFIVKWPEKIRPGSRCDSTVCLTDFMATCASIIQKKLPANAAEDSYDLMPLFTGNGNYQRKNIIMHSGDGYFAFRQGKWKLNFSAGSGGWGFPTEKKAAEMKLPSLQLYNLETDIGETINLENKYPGIVKQFESKIKMMIDNGRSTPGLAQKNDAKIILNK